MRYNTNPKNGDKISVLSFGGMRLPAAQDEVNAIVSEAIDLGVNYFDTAYIYPGNEEKLGIAFAECNGRDKIKIATKMPPQMISKYTDFDKIFDKQLTRLKTERIDYYMLHMLTNVKTWERLLSLGLLQWLLKKRAAGQVVNFGFSYHGGQGEFLNLLDMHSWDFTMIQYNYYDEFNQAGKTGLLRAYEKGVPVIAMEPLRGGMLVNLPPLALKEVNLTKHTPAEWGLMWCFNHKELITVLSGIGSKEQLRQNVNISETVPGALSENDLELFKNIVKAINAEVFVGCTGCNYCMPCPYGVDIPLCFSCLNDIKIKGALQGKIHYILRTFAHNASLCIACGKCEPKCPQGIKIVESLKLVTNKLEGICYKPMRFAIHKFMKMR